VHGNVETVPGRLSRFAAAAGAAARAAVVQQRVALSHRWEVLEQRRGAGEHRRFAAVAPRPRSSGSLAPDTAQLQRILDEAGLQWAIDDDGDLVVRWEKYNIYFFHYGMQDEVLQARLYLNRRFDVDLRPALALVLDDWNRSKLFPKAYTVLPDDGLVGICAEQAFDFEGGTSPQQLSFTIGMWMQNLQQFADWIEEHV
jgi:hypothetical protein